MAGRRGLFIESCGKHVPEGRVGFRRSKGEGVALTRGKPKVQSRRGQASVLEPGVDGIEAEERLDDVEGDDLRKGDHGSSPPRLSGASFSS